MITYLKKLRKELQKWLNIPHVLKLNKTYVKELQAKDDIIEEKTKRIEYLETNNRNKDTENFNLTREIEKLETLKEMKK